MPGPWVCLDNCATPQHNMLGLKRPGNGWFVLPWIAFIPWYGMLIAMLICWGVQGRPIYDFMDEYSNPIYISDIGATNLRPLFIACSAWQGLGWCLTVVAEYCLRGGTLPWLLTQPHFMMAPWFTKHERNLIAASCSLGIIGELGLLFCTIFSTKNYPHVHTAMVCVFVVLMFLSICCLTAEYALMGRHYALIHPTATTGETLPRFDELKWNEWPGRKWNKYTISAVCKFVWLVLAVVWAICFAAIDGKSRSADFEWLLAFWFGVIFVILSVDFYLGGRFRVSRYFHQISDYRDYYKYDEMRAQALNMEMADDAGSSGSAPKDSDEPL